jgi:predicted MPP superfamily phosphohydrolase
MRRLLSPFFLVLTALVAGLYAYVAIRITAGIPARLALAVPFALIWLVPIVYWGLGREKHGRLDDAVHAAAYLAMGWVNFLVLTLLVRDLALGASTLAGADALADGLRTHGALLVHGIALLAVLLGVLVARGGPRVERVTVAVDALDRRLDGLTIAQISDLHVGPTIGVDYVRRVVERTNALDADLVVLTGDIVDGSVERLRSDVAPLAELEPKGRRWFVLGNHDVYAGPFEWSRHFAAAGFRVLSNAHETFDHRGATVLLGGVTDPALRAHGAQYAPDPERAAGRGIDAAFRILLAHNPKLAPLAAHAGFDLQLSGHTHAGQFFPWTLAVKAVHAPHVAGLSRLGRMWVYVSAGTGSWGPPVRVGTRTEITLLTLRAA